MYIYIYYIYIVHKINVYTSYGWIVEDAGDPLSMIRSPHSFCA